MLIFIVFIKGQEIGYSSHKLLSSMCVLVVRESKCFRGGNGFSKLGSNQNGFLVCLLPFFGESERSESRVEKCQKKIFEEIFEFQVNCRIKNCESKLFLLRFSGFERKILRRNMRNFQIGIESMKRLNEDQNHDSPGIRLRNRIPFWTASTPVLQPFEILGGSRVIKNCDYRRQYPADLMDNGDLRDREVMNFHPRIPEVCGMFQAIDRQDLEVPVRVLR